MIKKMYIAIFEDGSRITKTNVDGIRSRLDMCNWICINRLGRNRGGLIEIQEWERRE